jgi:Putative peptidoglycan binding domain
MDNHNYAYLRFGDHLPTVGVLQKLLNRAGAKLDPDGIFGPKTLLAVRKFQHAHHLVPDGRVGKNTWMKLARGLELPIVDCVDIYDAAQQEEIQRQLKTEKNECVRKDLTKRLDELADSTVDADNIRAVGGNPFVFGGMSNGVEQAISMIYGAARDAFLLRFTGHGYPGSVGVSTGSKSFIERNKLNQDRLAVMAQDPVQLACSMDALHRSFGRLRAVFGPYGSCELHACQTGRGPEGTQFLPLFSSVIGVPVTAPINDQVGGDDTFKFRGPTRTATPNGAPLKTWCRALPDFPH